jgi:hypothetical protein
MKVTNTSTVMQRVRGVGGVEKIAPGRSRVMAFTEEGLARARGRRDLIVEAEPTQVTDLISIGVIAKHRGGGFYAIIGDDGGDIVSGLSKDEAEAFNAMSDEDKATFVAKAQS